MQAPRAHDRRPEPGPREHDDEPHPPALTPEQWRVEQAAAREAGRPAAVFHREQDLDLRAVSHADRAAAGLHTFPARRGEASAAGSRTCTPILRCRP